MGADFEVMEVTNIRGNRLSYLDRNQDKSDVILMVHGHPFDHTMWKYQYEALDPFRMINPDLFGYGQSANDFDRIYIEQQALDLALLLDHLNIDRVHLMGLSMGGQIIVEFSRLFPHRTKSLIICASVPSAEDEASLRKRIQAAQEIEEIGMLNHTHRSIDKYLNTRLHPPGSKVYNHLFSMMSGTTGSGAVASHRGRAARRDNMAYLSQLNIPALVVAGELDHFFRVEDVQAVANAIRQSEFVLIEDSGHLPNMENPDVFNGHIRRFLARVST